MNENFAKLVEQAERVRSAKIAKFLELLNDPDIRRYLSIFKNGQVSLDQEFDSATTKRAAPVGFRTGNGIQEAIKALALPPEFTSEDVFFNLNSQKFRFEAKDHRGSVRDALFKLSHGKNPTFKLIRKGAGGELSVYERIPL
jgi:hypothetical protein